VTLNDWQKIAREFEDHRLSWEIMVQQQHDEPVGDWLPSEQTAKEILRLRQENEQLRENSNYIALTEDAHKLLDEVARLRSMEATLQAIVRGLNEARGDGVPKLGIGGAYGAVVSLIGENEALRKAMEERETDMHRRIRAGYDKTVADSWRAANERLQARVEVLERVREAAQEVHDSCAGYGKFIPYKETDVIRLGEALDAAKEAADG
jgi:hypothetical protein